MKNIALILSLLALVLPIALTGCATTQIHTVKCAWCKEPIVTSQYTYDPLSKNVYDYSSDPSTPIATPHPVILGTANSQSEADALIQKNIAKAGISCDGFTFCSLKCVNAYQASKGVKEQRFRNVSGE